MTEFCPVILTEDPVPEAVKECRECGLYTQGTRMVWGEGNPAAPVMAILDNPGAREDKEGKAYVCGTRETLQRAVLTSGIRLEDLYVTYILKRRPVRAYQKEQVRSICMQHLSQQIEANKPKMIICLGNIAVQAFFENPEAEVKNLRGDWHNVSGIPTAVAYHPLAVRRRPNLWNLFIEDWRMIAERLAVKVDN